MKKIYIYTIILLLFISNGILAQQEAMFSQYMFNGMYVNPGYTGSKGYVSTSLLYRSQWVTLPGAPQTFLVSGDMPLTNEKIGLGMVLMHDKIGVTSQTDAHFNAAYHVQLNSKMKLGLGGKLGISNYNSRLSEVTVWDQNDQVFQNDITGNIIPRFGFGAFLYDSSFYVGVSVPSIMGYEAGHTFSIDIEKASSLARHYYLTGGYVYQIDRNWKIKPSALIKFMPDAPLQIDLNMSTMYKDQIWFGVSYRSFDAVVFILNYHANQSFSIGYAFDWTASKLSRYTAGSHEIMIGYDLGKKLKTIKSPRFF